MLHLDPHSSWKQLLEPKFPDTTNVFSVVFQSTVDAMTSRKVNPIEALGMCLKCGEVNRSFDMNVKCNCTSKDVRPASASTRTMTASSRTSWASEEPEETATGSESAKSARIGS